MKYDSAGNEVWAMQRANASLAGIAVNDKGPFMWGERQVRMMGSSS